MTTRDSARRHNRFGFGESWQSFIETVTEESVTAAKQGLMRLLPADEISGHSFLDIGCGSGRSMLAAAQLGPRSVCGIDTDPLSSIEVFTPPVCSPAVVTRSAMCASTNRREA